MSHKFVKLQSFPLNKLVSWNSE